MVSSFTLYWGYNVITCCLVILLITFIPVIFISSVWRNKNSHFSKTIWDNVCLVTTFLYIFISLFSAFILSMSLLLTCHPLRTFIFMALLLSFSGASLAPSLPYPWLCIYSSIPYLYHYPSLSSSSCLPLLPMSLCLSLLYFWLCNFTCMRHCFYPFLLPVPTFSLNLTCTYVQFHLPLHKGFFLSLFLSSTCSCSITLCMLIRQLVPALYWPKFSNGKYTWYFEEEY